MHAVHGASLQPSRGLTRKPISRYQRQSVEAWVVSALSIKQQGNAPEKLLERTFLPVKMIVHGETLLPPLSVSGRLCVRTESAAAVIHGSIG